MSEIKANISMSLDGYVAGPNDGLGKGLGDGGEVLPNWIFGGPWTYGNESFDDISGPDREIFDELFGNVGAGVVGRRMYDVVDGWGDEPPWGIPIFVVTHRAEPYAERGTTSYTFVTDGVASAVDQARQAADGKDVTIGGGASIVTQALAAGMVETSSRCTSHQSSSVQACGCSTTSAPPLRCSRSRPCSDPGPRTSVTASPGRPPIFGPAARCEPQFTVESDDVRLVGQKRAAMRTAESGATITSTVVNRSSVNHC